MDPPELATARLRLRAFRDDDFDAFAAIMAQDAAVRFLRYGVGLTGDEAEELFDDFLGEWDDGFGYRAIEDRRDGALLGYVGILPYDRGVGEIDFLLRPDHWHRGLATEAVRAVLFYAMDTLRLNRLVGAVHPANRAGQRVMEKVGMSHREDRRDSHGLKMYVYAITALERRMLRR